MASTNKMVETCARRPLMFVKVSQGIMIIINSHEYFRIFLVYQKSVSLQHGRFAINLIDTTTISAWCIMSTLLLCLNKHDSMRLTAQPSSEISICILSLTAISKSMFRD